VLGAELRKAREAAGLTQEQLAAKAHLSREYVSHLERDEYSPTLDVLLRLCAAMDAWGWQVVQRVEEEIRGGRQTKSSRR
jgi:transcriptional regulator with XRE-family HTH domain